MIHLRTNAALGAIALALSPLAAPPAFADDQPIKVSSPQAVKGARL